MTYGEKRPDHFGQPDEPTRTHGLFLGQQWNDKALENVERWGDQAVATLFLQCIEELGEIAHELQMDAGHGEIDQQAHRGFEFMIEMAGLGTRVRSYLEANFENDDGDPLPEDTRAEPRQAILGDLDDTEGVLEELDDLAPLLFQLHWAIEDLQNEPTDD